MSRLLYVRAKPRLETVTQKAESKQHSQPTFWSNLEVVVFGEASAQRFHDVVKSLHDSLERSNLRALTYRPAR